MKRPPKQFDKFAKKKSNAAIKEQFKQEKRKYKKEKEEYFEKKKAASRQAAGDSRHSAVGGKQAGEQAPTSHLRAPSSDLMPLNKFIAHSGVCGRREAADLVKKGLVKVNNELISEPGHKVSTKDEIRVNGKKIFL